MSIKNTKFKSLAGFFSRVDSTSQPNGCWLWIGPLNSSGYGSLSWEQGIVGSHVLAYEIEYGPVPKGTCVLHRCDVRSCCRPEHLFLGSKSDNSKDAWAKGRNFYQLHPELRPRGAKHTNAKLNAAQIVEIRARYKRGERQIDIAKDFGVSQGTISHLIVGRTYTCN
jgi:hypothetical protein